MKKHVKYILLIGFAVLVFSCSNQKYIFNTESYNRQQELKNARSAHVFEDVLTGSISIASSVFFSTEVEWHPTEQQYKKLNLVNPSTDTLYVNMLTDIYWDKNNYCDFMDIRIPPKENCRILVPVSAEYNIYFSITPQNDDDEMLQINTYDLKQITLKPGITMANESN